MDQRRLIIGIVVGLLVLGLLGAWSASTQQDAWTQGYLMGRLSASGEGGGAAGALAPYLYPGLAGGFGRPRFGPFGFIFPLLFLGLGVFLVSRFFRVWAWRRGGPWGHPGPGGRPWGGERGAEGQFGPPWMRPEGSQPPTSEPAPQPRPEPGPSGQQPGPTSYV